MSGVDELVQWLRAQLDSAAAETEKLLTVANRTVEELKDPALLGTRVPGWHSWAEVKKMCQDVLAEVEAKRRIVEGYENTDGGPWGGCGDDCEWKAIGWTIKVLALPYADRPGYRDEWRPA